MTGTGALARNVASERGAILIQVGVAILVMSAFSMFVIDYGVAWISRSQAQNSADAGAIAGATALALDDFGDRTDTGPAKLAAREFALRHVVWGEAPDVEMATDVRFYPNAPAEFPALCSGDDCVRVDVYRNQARGNALPVFFGWLVGLTQQGVRASAIAQAARGNASECLKPWAVLDKWMEPTGIWNQDSEFDPKKDIYIAPTANKVGTTYTLARDLGLKLTLKEGDSQNAKEKFGAGWYSPVVLDKNGAGGEGGYGPAISGCVGVTYKIGDTLPVENGGMVGPTKHGVDDLVALDPDASWDPVEKKVVDSCVGPPYTCSKPGYKQSPRIVALPVINTRMAYDEVHKEDGKQVGAGNMTVKIVAILGFFVEGKQDKDVVGYLATKPELKVSNGGGVHPAAGFLKTVQLVR
jgi:Flp pilus assembly protein TadG